MLRSFLRSFFGWPREPSLLEAWVAQYEEDAVEPDIPILDCHHHLMDFVQHDKGHPQSKRERQRFYSQSPQLINDYLVQSAAARSTNGPRSPWAAPRYMSRELLKDISGHGKRGHNIVGTVYLECGWKTPGVEKCMEPMGEVAMVTEEHRLYPAICQSIVAHADLTLGAAVEPLLMHYKKNSLVKGIRYSLAWADDPVVGSGHANSSDTASEPKFREGFGLLSKYGFVFDSFLYHENLEAFMDLAKAYPETTMVCNHTGLPLGIGKYDRASVFPVWKERMQRLAQHENVYVKIGGLGMPCTGFGFDDRDFPPTSDELAAAWGPYVHACIEFFGVDRCMMESNFPVDRSSCSYTVLFNALKKTVAGHSMDAKRKMFALNAARIYSVTLPRETSTA